MPNIGPLEIAVVLIIVLIVFGPKRLPELGRSMGRGIREFRSSVGGKGDQDEKDGEDDSADKRPELEANRTSEEAEPVEGEVITSDRRT